MRKLTIKLFAVAACLLLFTVAASAQDSSGNARSDDDNIVVEAAKGLGKTGVIVVGSAAKVTWVTTKFAAKHVAKPVAKTVFLKAAPKLVVMGLKTSGTAAKHLTPIAVKLALL